MLLNNRYYLARNINVIKLWEISCISPCLATLFGLNLFILHRLWTSYYNLAKSLSMTASWVNKSTSTRAHCVVCERHEVQSRRRRDSNPRPSDPWSDTLPLDQLSSTLGINKGSVDLFYTYYIIIIIPDLYSALFM